jgi:glutathione S-transferase
VRTKLYGLALSHPAHAARLMLEHKRIEHDVVDLLPGMHPIQLRLAGFRGTTVPALRIDGRRIEGSRVISRALDEIVPEPPLFPAEHRQAVQAAEEWGERVLQPVPRRIFRWAVSRDVELRRWFARELRMPAPNLVAALNAPIARTLARKVHADDDERVRGDVLGLPALLDKVDALIEAGTIGGSQPNAADFQIGTTVRVLGVFPGFESLMEGRPAAELGRRLLPEFEWRVPPFLPPAWIAELRSDRAAPAVAAAETAQEVAPG